MCATSLLALSITSCGAFAPYTTDDPKFREWAASAIDTAANKAGQSVADALHIEDGATVAVITESIKNATGEAAETLRAALEKDGEARRAALYDWAQKFMAAGSQVAGVAGGATGNPLLMALAALMSAGAGAAGVAKLKGGNKAKGPVA